MALENVINWQAAGLDAIHVAYRGSSGYMAGWANLAAADEGEGSGMRRLWLAQTIPMPLPEPIRRTNFGDNTRGKTFTFENPELNNALLQLGTFDIDAENAFEGTTAYELGDWTFRGRGGNKGNPGSFMLLVTREADSDDTGNEGPGFENQIVFNNEIAALGQEQKAHQELGPNRYSITPDYSSVLPWGVAMSTAFGTSRRLDTTWFSQKRAMMYVFVGDGTVDDIVVDYVPVSDVAKIKAFNALTGAALTVSAVTPGTKTITLSAAPTAGVVVVLIYECESF